MSPYNNSSNNSQWHALASDSAAVIAKRLTQLPLQWLMTPIEAHDETRLMIEEKQAAVLETQWVLAQMPWRFWLDAWTGNLAFEPQKAIKVAASKANRRLIGPSRKRVKANQRRLSTK